MRLKIIFHAIVLASLFCLTAEGRQGIVSLNYPPNRSVVAFDLLSISLNVPQASADMIEISVNGRQQWRKTPPRDAVCFSVQLEPGVNKIDIIAKNRKRIVDEINLEVFRRSDLVSKYSVPPAGFERDNFHGKDRPRCARCHAMEPGEGDKKFIGATNITAEISANNPAKVRESTCYDCHRSMTAYPFVHAPLSIWSCLSCHNPNAEPKYTVQTPDTALCFTCHVKQKENWFNKKYYHAPIVAGKCAVCHNPHGSDNPAILIKPTWLLCITCHNEKGNGAHIVAGYFKGGTHPTHGVQDPRRKGKELTCASCHDPHVSYWPNFLTLTALKGFAVCKECHVDQRKLFKSDVPLP